MIANAENNFQHGVPRLGSEFRTEFTPCGFEDFQDSRAELGVDIRIRCFTDCWTRAEQQREVLEYFLNSNGISIEYSR